MFVFDGVAPEAVFTVFACAGVFFVGGMLALIGEMVFEEFNDD